MLTRRDISLLVAAAVITTSCIVATACGLDIEAQAVDVADDAGTKSSSTDPSQQQQQQQQQQDTPDGSSTRIDDDGGGSVVDAGNIFTAPDAAVEAGVVCNKTALLLTDTDSDSLNGAASAFTQAGFTVVTKVTDYTKYDGTPSPSGMGVVVILNGATGSEDMAPAGQQAIVTALSAGTGLVAEEWSGWLVGHNKFKTLAPYILFQASSKGSYYGDSPVSLTLTSAAHPIWTNLPTKLTTARTTVVVVGSARPGPITVIAPATVGQQTTSGPGVLVSAQGITRVVGTSLAVNYSTVQEDALNKDANVRALFTNMALWAAHCL